MVSHNLDKKSQLKSAKKEEKSCIICLYKDVSVNFFILFKLFSKLQELSCGKVK